MVRCPIVYIHLLVTTSQVTLGVWLAVHFHVVSILRHFGCFSRILKTHNFLHPNRIIVIWSLSHQIHQAFGRCFWEVPWRPLLPWPLLLSVCPQWPPSIVPAWGVQLAILKVESKREEDLLLKKTLSSHGWWQSSKQNVLRPFFDTV